MEFWWIQIWEVKSEKAEEHDKLQKELREWNLKEEPEMRPRLRYLRLNEDGKELRMLIKTGFTDMTEVEAIRTRPRDEGYMKLHKVAMTCIVPDTHQERFWYDVT